ncbi:MAG TPA: MFS transporter [Anaerolineaceae bacterium]|nr:MFS transporter [Anaerolineaceae bacterium]HPN51668.1 MFS transporter [Anaerolineaceae bacterium]
MEHYKDFKRNYALNLLDGSFFGFAMGFASFSAVIPLFVYQLTSSATLVGLIPAIHNMGWQLPQLFSARSVSQQPYYKKMVLLMTIQERLPFLGLAILAAFVPIISKEIALFIAFVLLIWQGLGAGITANAWQNFICRIIPADSRATFLGFQASAANLLQSIGAVLAGLILGWLSSPLDFITCFLITCVLMTFSWLALAASREPASSEVAPGQPVFQNFWRDILVILRKDRSFRWFLASRIVFPFASMSFSFFVVYALEKYHMADTMVSLLASVLFFAQVLANLILGRLADRWDIKTILEGGAIATILCTLLAWVITSDYILFVVMILAGIANTAYWTIGMAFIMRFGTNVDRPAYIGLANTSIAPATILAPLLGGFLVDNLGFPVMFGTTIMLGIVNWFILHFMVNERSSRRANA